MYGTWADHLSAWRPWERADTLLLRYEDMTSNLPFVLEEISRYLGLRILSHTVPERDRIADIALIWVRRQTDWRESITQSQLELFERVNGAMMGRMGYGSSGDPV
ncbi:MAG: sulfotransferase domain-containing protein [Gammaproteobacteria bacterium]|nr:sulfotransferase domain-containing protein [Gammaproteobacteria bacterium]